MGRHPVPYYGAGTIPLEGINISQQTPKLPLPGFDKCNNRDYQHFEIPDWFLIVPCRPQAINFR
jgi:hypothetical protein